MKNNMELRHVFDLANRSYNNNQYTFTDFLTPAELGDFLDNLSDLPPCGYTIYGGYEGAERVVLRFGREADLGYEESFPIVYVRIEPVNAKFAEDLTHRDVLGSIMNLGMEREKLGDIIVKNGKIWVICLTSLASLITSELTRIRHTTVYCKVEETLPEDLSPQFEELRIQVAQARADAVVAKLCKLSRNGAATLFLEGKVAIGGRAMQNHSYTLKEQDVVSVRGFGKYRYIRAEGTTKKGNNILLFERFV